MAGIYLSSWSKISIRDLPAAYNLIYAAFATGDGGGGGTVVYDPSPAEDPAALASDIAAAHARGQRVILSVGGSNDLGIHLLDGAEASQMFSSVTAIIDRFGFDGLDWDLETDTNWNIGTITAISRSLKTTYGVNFIISAAPAPNDTQWKTWAAQAGSILDLFGMQFYEYPATDSERISGIASRIREMVQTYGVHANKLMIGAKTTAGSCSTCVSSPAVYLEAFRTVETQYSELRGAYVWDSELDQSTGWNFADVTASGIRAS